MAQVDRSFIGEGIIYARLYQSQDALIDIGNCDVFNISFESDRQTLPNYRGGGGNRNVHERVTDVTSTIGMYDLTATNIARVTRSTISAIAEGTVTAEACIAGGVEGELIPFRYLPDITQPVVVRAAGGTDPLQPGTDYLLTPHGIIRTGSSAITAAGVEVDYTRLKQSAIQMLNGTAQELELYIAGLNDAQSGEPFALRPRRVKFGMLSELAVLGQEYARLEGPAELLADPLVTANDISQFCEMEVLDKAA